jgi:hypothetical protein
MKNILIIIGLGGLAYYLFGSKSPSPMFTNPKISIPDKTGDVESTPKTTPPIVVKKKDSSNNEATNSLGKYNTLDSIFN